ncbi:NnrS family protein [Sulfurifustis variabilis]|uniref:NnrS family protein n=1 Tax=Sulfurifustis variabilis TaxID=1675686 RepID=A0A1B4V048_9GAMM|nr:NnrS family protein [Sulfurifustis variabilis]BAU46820.1 NnrS family protein [Sulfurifustis variabilis]
MTGQPNAFWPVLTAAPHRPLFAAGGVQLVATMLFWALELAARLPVGVPAMTYAVPAPWVHAALMLYGIFPFFIFGFLLTVYPRWLGLAPVPRGGYVRVFLLMAPGAALLYVGAYAHAAVLGLALGLMAAGWASGLASLLAVARQSRDPGPHVRTLNLALAAGLLGLLALLGAVLAGGPVLYLVAREAGLWLFLVPVIFVVSHRMIPFFSQSALAGYEAVRPAFSLPVMGVCVLGHFLAEVAGLPAWRFLFDAPLAALALHHTWRWNFRRSFEVGLLAMLHIAFLWLGIAMTLYTAQSIALLVGVDGLGRTPLHALGIGFIAGMAIAMASRVTLGHSGRPLAADNVTWAVLLGLNVVALVRIAAEFLPATPLNLVAALGWLAAMGVWALRYTPMYARRRLDGKPG